jgi:type II secretory pathway pseudopilin PulG
MSERGYSLLELLVVAGLITVLTVVSVPVFLESTARNRAWTAAEMIGASVRQARLRAISRNTPFQVRFDCPVPGSFRLLIMTGDPAVDDAADRCWQTLDGDGGVMAMPERVTYGEVPTLQVNGRGIYTSLGGSIPQEINVIYGGMTRTLTVSAAGQIGFRTVEAGGTVVEHEAEDQP